MVVRDALRTAAVGFVLTVVFLIAVHLLLN
jgi:hypothetical protein